MLSGAGAVERAAPTIVSRRRRRAARPRRPHAAYRTTSTSAPPRRRPIWPWLLALLLIAARARGRLVYAFGKIQDRSTASSRSPCRTSSGSGRTSRCRTSTKKGSTPHRPAASRTTRSRRARSTTSARKRGCGSTREARSTSTSRRARRRSRCPTSSGKSRDDAIAQLTAAKLKFKVLPVFSKEDTDTVSGAVSGAGGKVVNQGIARPHQRLEGTRTARRPECRRTAL